MNASPNAGRGNGRLSSMVNVICGELSLCRASASIANVFATASHGK